MTSKEALFKLVKRLGGLSDYTEDDLYMAVVDDLNKLREKETPLKVIDHRSQLGGQCFCPNCKNVILTGEVNYCPECGQKLEW